MRTSILLSSAAVLVTSATAFAADLPTKKAAPVEYVRICNLGNGAFVGYLIPGSDVCLKVGGFARWQYTYGQPYNTFAKDAAGGRIGSRGYGTQMQGQIAVGAVQLDARTQTEYGLLRSFVDIRADTGFGSGGAGIDKAWVQLGGFQAGKYQSYFDFYADAFNNLGTLGSDRSVVGAAYTAIFGNFSAALSLEDSKPALGMPGYYGDTAFGDKTSTEYFSDHTTIGGNRVPDVVARFLYADSWGQVQLSAASHQIRVSNTFVTSDSDTKYGFAVQGGVKVNVPSLGSGDALYLQAAYGDGATQYVGATGALSGAGRIAEVAYAADGSFDSDTGKLKTAKAWSALGAFSHSFTPTVSAALWAGYTDINYPSNTMGRDFHYWQVGTQANWSPVKNLTVSGTVNYVNGTAKKLADDEDFFSSFKKSSNGVSFALRVQRDF